MKASVLTKNSGQLLRTHLSNYMNTIQSNLHDEPLTVRIKSILEESYDLGRLVRIAEIFGGYCNKSYGVWLLKGDGLKKYLLRQYNPNLAESDIRFEHALLNHLKQKGFDLACWLDGCRRVNESHAGAT